MTVFRCTIFLLGLETWGRDVLNHCLKNDLNQLKSILGPIFDFMPNSLTCNMKQFGAKHPKKSNTFDLFLVHFFKRLI